MWCVEDGKVKDSHYELLDVDPEKYPADPGMLQLVDEVSAPFKEQLSKVVGSTKNTLVRYYVIENPMDNLIIGCDHVEAEARDRHQQRLPVLPADRGRWKTPTPITNDHIWSMIPVDSEAKYGEATGQQIWDWLEKELHNVFAKDPANASAAGWFASRA